METHEPQGALPRLWARLFGVSAKRLRERVTRAHWLSYLLIIAQSIAVVLVFGHAEVTYLLAPSAGIRIAAALTLFLLVVTVIAADLALLESMTRIPVLKRNRQAGALFEHRAYQFFVLAVEGATYGVVLYTLDSDPQALIQSRSLIPTSGLAFLALVVLRVLLISWSAVQLIIVREKLPVLLSTLTNTMKEIVGGHVEQQLKTMDVSHIEVNELFGVYAEAVKPPRPIDGVMNWLTGGWIVRRALLQEAEEERQSNNVLTALGRINAHPPISAAAVTAEPATPQRRLSPREQRRAQLERDMYGYNGHPTSPRPTLDELDEDDGPDWGVSGNFDDADPWQDEDARMLRAGRLDMSNHTGRRDRAQAARIAPRGAEMTVREAFVMPDLPASRYERDEDSDQRRAVFRVLDQALAQHESLTRAEVADRAGVSENTVRSARPLWNDRRKNDAKGKRKAAPVTTEFPAVTADMLTVSR